MASPIKYRCAYCKTAFQSTKKRVYCSVRCRGQAQSERSRKKCVICRKAFVGKRKAFCCSVECKHTYQKRNKREITCEVCGATFLLSKTQAERRKCCSKKCSNQAKRNRKTKPCLCCNKEMSLTGWQFERTKFCSNKCNGKFFSTKERRKCPVCLTEFQARRGDRKAACSPQCAGVHKRGDRVDGLCVVCGKRFSETPCYAERLSTCVDCRGTSQTSKGEQELLNFVRSLGVEAESRAKELFPGRRFEVDVWVPSIRLAVEFHGLSWHSNKITENGKKDYHKFRCCVDEGIRLVQIYDDDWRDRRGIFEDLLRTVIVGRTGRRAYGAQVRELSYKEAEEFLNSYHYLSGRKTRGSLYLGLFDRNKDLVSVSVFLKKSKGVVEWTRHAVKAGVRVWNPASRLLDEAVKRLKPKTVVSFSDNRLHDGTMYKALGFSLKSKVPVSYEYTDGTVRRHKFSFRVPAGEDEIAEAGKKGWYRVYDSGKNKWVLPVSES